MLTVNRELTQDEYNELRWNVIRYMEEVGGEIRIKGSETLIHKKLKG